MAERDGRPGGGTRKSNEAFRKTHGSRFLGVACDPARYPGTVTYLEVGSAKEVPEAVPQEDAYGVAACIGDAEGASGDDGRLMLNARYRVGLVPDEQLTRLLQRTLPRFFRGRQRSPAAQGETNRILSSPWY